MLDNHQNLLAKYGNFKRKKKARNLPKPSEFFFNFKTFFPQNIIFRKKSSKRNQNPSRYYYNSIITNLKFQHKQKISSFKNPHIKIKQTYYLLLPSRGQNPLSYYNSIMNLKHNNILLALVGKANNRCLRGQFPLNLLHYKKDQMSGTHGSKQLPIISQAMNILQYYPYFTRRNLFLFWVPSCPTILTKKKSFFFPHWVHVPLNLTKKKSFFFLIGFMSH